jgi:hypothetical protein
MRVKPWIHSETREREDRPAGHRLLAAGGRGGDACGHQIIRKERRLQQADGKNSGITGESEEPAGRRDQEMARPRCEIQKFVRPALDEVGIDIMVPGQETKAMSVMTLYPYLYHGMCWVFDDPETGLKEEAFVLGASEMISKLIAAKCIPNAEHGFMLSFSDQPFEYDVELSWISPEQAAQSPDKPAGSLPATGNWYQGVVAGDKMVAWLCPALYEYFLAAPEKIFVRGEKLPAGIDPIWHVGSNDPQARRYMSAELDSL